MSTPLVPPIPARLADRPTLGGLVVPYITVQTNTDRAYLGQVHGRKMVECVTKGLCQACGQQLSRPMVLFVDAEKLGNRFSAEPPLHPECAAYSARACPMLAGQMTHFRRSESPHLRDRCDQPGCATATAHRHVRDRRGVRAGHACPTTTTKVKTRRAVPNRVPAARSPHEQPAQDYPHRGGHRDDQDGHCVARVARALPPWGAHRLMVSRP